MSIDLSQAERIVANEDTRKDRVKPFRDSVTPDLYTPDDLINWEDINDRLLKVGDALQALQSLASLPSQSVETIAKALENEPKIYEVLRTLLAVNSTVGFQDGRELPEHIPARNDERRELADLLLALGIQNILAPGIEFEALVRVALIGQNAGKRRFRVRGRFGESVKQLLTAALRAASEKLSSRLKILPDDEFPEQAKRGVEYVIAVDDVPFAAIATVFQARTGGRQQRDLTLTYPALQKRLDEIPVGLIIIADGRGIKQTPTWVLSNLFQEVAACMTINQAKAGLLQEAIINLVNNEGRREGLNVPLNRLISNALQSTVTINASDLPGTLDNARLALANYTESHPELDLTLTPDGSVLTWKRADLVKRVIDLADSVEENEVDADEALNIFAQLLSVSEERVDLALEANGFRCAKLSIGSDTVLPSTMIAVGTKGEVDTVILRRIAKVSLRYAPEAKLATLIVPHAPNSRLLSGVQSTLAATVAVIDYADLTRLAQDAISPRDGFVSMVVERSDLTKVSPFVVRGVTPRHMFFGREAEQATLISTLATNSVALLGGRRVGKTSLMQQAKTWLQEADFRPFFGDCQAVGNWSDFGRMVRREWNTEANVPFKPHDLFDVVTRLDDGSGRPLVLLLDEIDRLLDWDYNQTESGVNEAFFRTCRTISQEGKAQFVFSGERIIAQKLWDPHSPHWNFCRPLQLQQLNSEASEKLLLDPLQSLQIEVDNLTSFRKAAWHYTSGHPQIIQFLGDRLVGLLNGRPRETRGVIQLKDLKSIVESFDYAEHYLETYWGQAIPFEKLISILVAGGTGDPPEIADYIRQGKIDVAEADVARALRMLELYGIIRREGTGYSLRAEWFLDALSYYGGVDQTINLFVENLT